LKISVKGFSEKTARFFREVRAELKKVMWPNRHETFVFTVVVLVSVGLVSSLIWIIDSIFSKGLGLVIK